MSISDESKAMLSSMIGIYLIILGIGEILPEQTLVISFFRLTNVFFFFPIVPTTGTPNRIANFFKSIAIPFFFASSNKFTQTIMLDVISII